MYRNSTARMKAQCGQSYGIPLGLFRINVLLFTALLAEAAQKDAEGTGNS